MLRLAAHQLSGLRAVNSISAVRPIAFSIRYNATIAATANPTFTPVRDSAPTYTATVQTVAPHPKQIPDPNSSRQWKQDEDRAALKDYMMRHPVYTPQELEAVKVTWRHRDGLSDRVAFGAIKALRLGFDKATNYTDKTGVMTETQWINRMVFLETLAGVPGMVGGMVRHLRSLRLLKRDNGWVHTLLEEAENERMHLLTFMKLKQPSLFFRAWVLASQGVFFNLFFLSYLVSPKTCHRFVGYLEEEAVHTYTNCLKDIEAGKINHWKTQPAPKIAIEYWRLKENATVQDVIRAVRADEASHRDVNHTLAGLKADDPNPF